MSFVLETSEMEGPKGGRGAPEGGSKGDLAYTDGKPAKQGLPWQISGRSRPRNPNI